MDTKLQELIERCKYNNSPTECCESCNYNEKQCLTALMDLQIGDYVVEEIKEHVESDISSIPKRKCLRSTCPNGETKCCLECKSITTCDRLGKCSWDNDHLDLGQCSEEE